MGALDTIRDYMPAWMKPAALQAKSLTARATTSDIPDNTLVKVDAPYTADISDKAKQPAKPEDNSFISKAKTALLETSDKLGSKVGEYFKAGKNKIASIFDSTVDSISKFWANLKSDAQAVDSTVEKMGFLKKKFDESKTKDEKIMYAQEMKALRNEQLIPQKVKLATSIKAAGTPEANELAMQLMHATRISQIKEILDKVKKGDFTPIEQQRFARLGAYKLKELTTQYRAEIRAISKHSSDPNNSPLDLSKAALEDIKKDMALVPEVISSIKQLSNSSSKDPAIAQAGAKILAVVSDAKLDAAIINVNIAKLDRILSDASAQKESAVTGEDTKTFTGNINTSFVPNIPIIHDNITQEVMDRLAANRAEQNRKDEKVSEKKSAEIREVAGQIKKSAIKKTLNKNAYLRNIMAQELLASLGNDVDTKYKVEKKIENETLFHKTPLAS